MKKTKLFYKIMSASLIASMLMFGGCSNDNNDATDKDETLVNDKNNDDSDKDDKKDKKDKDDKESFDFSEEELSLYDELFSLDSEVKINVDIDNEELAKIQKDYEKYEARHSKSPIDRMCNVTITVNGKDYFIEEVGIKMKGNTSRTDFYDSSKGDFGMYNLIHFKLSFDETFDDKDYYGDDAKEWNDKNEKKERKNRTFATLSGLEVKWNREVDSTYLRETYAFKMYRDLGCLAPNNTIGNIAFNDSSLGIFKIYEPVDKTFIKRNLDEEDWGGDLYKCTWASGPANYRDINGNAGVDDEDLGKRYTYSLKTNKKTSNNEALSNFASVINANDVDLEKIKSVLDEENFVKFMAISYFLGMPDDMRNNYNNHYVYFKKSTNEAIFIAYDCDLCLGIDQWNPNGEYMTKIDPFSKKADGAKQRQRNNLIKKSLCEDGILYDEYVKALEEVANSKWLTYENFDEMYKKIEAHYSDKVVPDRNYNNLNSAQKTMSIDGTYNENGTTNHDHNLKIDNYFKRILDTYHEKTQS